MRVKSSNHLMDARCSGDLFTMLLNGGYLVLQNSGRDGEQKSVSKIDDSRHMSTIINSSAA
jgi:hypothetical protein